MIKSVKISAAKLVTSELRYSLGASRNAPSADRCIQRSNRANETREVRTELSAFSNALPHFGPIGLKIEIKSDIHSRLLYLTSSQDSISTIEGSNVRKTRHAGREPIGGNCRRFRPLGLERSLNLSLESDYTLGSRLYWNVTYLEKENQSLEFSEVCFD